VISWVGTHPCLEGHELTGDRCQSETGCRVTQGAPTSTCDENGAGTRSALTKVMTLVTIALAPRVRTFGGETWEEKRARLDAEWEPLVDEKKRKVHGWAHIEEIPAHLLGRVLSEGSVHRAIGYMAFGVQLIATRDGMGFGASPRTTWYATREAAIAYARKALAQQGKRYAKKYGVKGAAS
jgi:hypothetical protein